MTGFLLFGMSVFVLAREHNKHRLWQQKNIPLSRDLRSRCACFHFYFIFCGSCFCAHALLLACFFPRLRSPSLSKYIPRWSNPQLRGNSDMNGKGNYVNYAMAFSFGPRCSRLVLWVGSGKATSPVLRKRS